MGEIELNTKWGNAAEIAQMYKQERNPKLAKRLNAIRLLMQGYSRQEVAQITSVSRQSVHSWIHKWNTLGKEGLRNKSGGKKSKVTPEIRAEITRVVEKKIQTSRGIITAKVIHGYLKKA